MRILGRETGRASLLILLRKPGGSELDCFTGGATLYNMGSLRIVARGTAEEHTARMCVLWLVGSKDGRRFG